MQTMKGRPLFVNSPHDSFKKKGGGKFQCIAHATMKTIDRGETTHMTCLVIHSISHPSTLSYLVCLRGNHSNNNSRSYLLNTSDTKACCFCCCCMQLTQMSPCQCFYISSWVCLFLCATKSFCEGMHAEIYRKELQFIYT